ncbi:MAG: GNAT family N-acetyltransferase [Sinomicrobium sp.]|nr:GNAT family N-acetyltransferase [Sinomicrobium sp.]
MEKQPMKLDCQLHIRLEDRRVAITPLHWDHFGAMLPIALAHPDLLRYSPSDFGTEAALKAYFENALQERAQNRRYPFAIYDKRCNRYAGSTSYMNIANADLRLEIGSTWIGKAFQRTGLNRHCKFLLLQYAFGVLQFERVEFRTDSRNNQSRNAIQDIGATYEGELRSHMLMPDGYRRDTVCYSILKHEWPEISTTVFNAIKNDI